MCAQPQLAFKSEVLTTRDGLPQAFIPGIVQDKQGFMWIATRDGLCRFDGRHFKIFRQATDGKPGLSSLGIHGLLLDNRGQIWIFSDSNDIDILDPVKETFTPFSQTPFYRKNFGNERPHTRLFDRQGKLWITFIPNKVVCINVNSLTFTTYTTPEFSYLQNDQQGQLWALSWGKLYRLNEQTGQWTQQPIPDEKRANFTLLATGELFIVGNHSVYLFNPQSGQTQSFDLPDTYTNIQQDYFTYIATGPNGDAYFNKNNYLFRFSRTHKIEFIDKTLSNNNIRSLAVDASNTLWVGTILKGIVKYNTNTNGFESTPYQSTFFHTLFQQEFRLTHSQMPLLTPETTGYFFRYTYDQTGDLWFTIGDRQVYKLNLNTHQITSFRLPDPLFKLPNFETMLSLSTDPEGHLWVISNSAIMWLEQGEWHLFPFFQRNITSVSNQSIGRYERIIQAVVDQQYLWIATDSNGLYRINRQTGQSVVYRNNPRKPGTLSGNQIFCLFQDPDDSNILWIGTFGNGLCRFDKRTGICKRFTTQQGLPNNVVYSALSDRQGFLWIGTNKGLSRMNKQTFQITNFTQDDGLLENEFNRFHYFQFPDGKIVMGGPEGMVSFYPKQVRGDTFQPLTQITTIHLNNQILQPGLLTDSLPVQSLKQLDLAYNQNFIGVEFAAMQYNSLGKMRYRYQLEGLDKEWIVAEQPLAQYTDLRPGQYTLRLNVSNTTGAWSKHVRTLPIVINPPWWNSWWALSLYVLIGSVVAYILVRLYTSRQETRQLKQLDAMRTRFFTNITHEFRTPLTLILGPIEHLKEETHSSRQRFQFELIEQNANKLLGLINQLMELARADAKALQINEIPGELSEFVAKLVQSFDQLATSKQITLQFQADQCPAQYWFDHEKLERILVNLLNNAFKFTPNNGQISVCLSIINSPVAAHKKDTTAEKTWFQLQVIDNGIGIAPNALGHIFDRFFQADAGRTRQYEGTGIGLSLVKELVELQSGRISVKSQPQQGTTFTVELPYRPTHTIPQPAVKHVFHSVAQPEPVTDLLATVETDAPIILVIEDNQALGDFVANSLPAFYQVHRAINGQEGLQKAFELIPDLIVSDVMMPLMDGFTLCSTLKKDPRSSHIPIILLTAKSTVANRLEGLHLGADDYIVKPFSMKELQLRIRNLLERQRQHRKWLLESVSSPDVDQLESPPSLPQTDPLIEKLSAIIETHLDDSSFGVEELIAQSGFSRMNLHRKLKAVMGESAGEFIRTYRLKRAAQFLQKGHPVSETAYLVGFEDPSYFARSFRKTYQLSPSEFVKYQKYS